MAIAMNETLWIPNAHAHATKLTRNGVARYSVMRVARCGGRMGGGGVRVRVEDLEETWGQEHTLAVLLKK